jgi:DNA-binding CsgD family transcriptional regulator
MNRASIDERGFELARRIRKAHGDMSLADLKKLMREQFNILLIDQKAALDAIPSMLPPDLESREKAYELIQQLMLARGELSAEDNDRMKEIARLFGLDGGKAKSHLREVAKKPQSKAS